METKLEGLEINFGASEKIAQASLESKVFMNKVIDRIDGTGPNPFSIQQLEKLRSSFSLIEGILDYERRAGKPEDWSEEAQEREFNAIEFGAKNLDFKLTSRDAISALGMAGVAAGYEIGSHGNLNRWLEIAQKNTVEVGTLAFFVLMAVIFVDKAVHKSSVKKSASKQLEVVYEIVTKIDNRIAQIKNQA